MIQLRILLFFLLLLYIRILVRAVFTFCIRGTILQREGNKKLTEKVTERETDRQTDRQRQTETETDRQIKGETGTQRDRQTDRQTESHRERVKQRQPDRLTATERRENFGYSKSAVSRKV